VKQAALIPTDNLYADMGYKKPSREDYQALSKTTRELRKKSTTEKVEIDSSAKLVGLFKFLLEEHLSEPVQDLSERPLRLDFMQIPSFDQLVDRVLNKINKNINLSIFEQFKDDKPNAFNFNIPDSFIEAMEASGGTRKNTDSMTKLLGNNGMAIFRLASGNNSAMGVFKGFLKLILEKAKQAGKVSKQRFNELCDEFLPQIISIASLPTMTLGPIMNLLTGSKINNATKRDLTEEQSSLLTDAYKDGPLAFLQKLNLFYQTNMNKLKDHWHNKAVKEDAFEEVTDDDRKIQIVRRDKIYQPLLDYLKMNEGDDEIKRIKNQVSFGCPAKFAKITIKDGKHRMGRNLIEALFKVSAKSVANNLEA